MTLPSVDIFNPTSATYLGQELALSATGSFTLNATTQRFAGMVVPSRNATVQSLEVYVQSHAGSFVAMTVELQSDNGSGAPSGTVLQTASWTPTANLTWHSVSITNQAVTKGTKYWVVVYSSLVSGTNSLTLRYVNETDAVFKGVVFDAQTSSNSGSTYASAGAATIGCVGFGYNDATFEGQAYVDFDTISLTNSATNTWGENFQVPSVIVVNQIAFRVEKTAAGTPSADLLWFLYNVDTATQLDTGTLVTAAAVTTSYVWYVVNLTSNLLLTTGVNYRAYMQSAATVSPQYQAIKPKTSNTGNGNAMSFENTVAQAFNGTSTSNDRDMSFRLYYATPTVRTKTETGISRITQTVTKTETGISRITAATTKTESATARITATTIKTETGVSRITATTVQTLTGVSNITASASTATKTETGTARITALATKTESATARVTASTQRTLSGTASILSTVSRSSPKIVLVDGNLALRLSSFFYTKL